jgi:hypothetical protein
MQFPLPLCRVVDSTNLLQVFDGDAGACLVFDKDVFPRFGMFLVIRAFSKANTVVLDVVFDTVLLPRHRGTRVFLVDAVSVVVVVVFLAVTGRIRTVIGFPLAVPRVEGFSEFLQNALTGLRMQSFVLGVTFQLGFEVAVVRNLTRVLPDLLRVVVRDVPELAGVPPVQVEHLLYL